MAKDSCSNIGPKTGLTTSELIRIAEKAECKDPRSSTSSPLVCCHEVDIEKPCSVYADQGYSCLESGKCLDSLTDDPYGIFQDLQNPSIGTCPSTSQKCCKSEIKEVPTDTKKCEDSPGFQCTKVHNCDPNEPIKRSDSSSQNLFERNEAGFVLNNEVSLCSKKDREVCCKPKPKVF